MEERELCQASLRYVFLLQEVEERKKFEFVETVSVNYVLFFFLGGILSSDQSNPLSWRSGWMRLYLCHYPSEAIYVSNEKCIVL